LAIYEEQLIAGGSFTDATGTPIGPIASWDGTSWSTLDLESDFPVYALGVYDNRLFVGGLYEEICSWNGVSWSSIGTVNNGHRYGPPHAFWVYQSQLIAGGYFTIINGTSIRFIGSWDGSFWSSHGAGVNGPVHALAIYKDRLIAGGWFTMAGGEPANKIASWDGVSWSPLGTGLDSTVSALTVYEGQLIAGGFFATAGSVSANYIASWNDTSWSALGSGMNGPVFSLANYDNRLIVGGAFTTAGDKVCPNIAIWNPHYREELILPQTYSLSQNYPNPFNTSTIIRYEIPEQSAVSLKVYNVMGQEIKTLVKKDQQAGYYEVTWDGRDEEGQEVSTGIYLCNLKIVKSIRTIKMVLLR
jgi:hypothetical protein